MLQDALGDRMKGYENVSNHTLIKRMPVIIRLDGKAFHSYLSSIKRQNPFNDEMHELMTKTMEHLCENIQNAVFGYTQSDEISILLNDWKTFETQQWFGGSLQKMTSVAASMATGFFNAYKAKHDLLDKVYPWFDVSYTDRAEDSNTFFNFAMFDARTYNIPKEDVTNYFVWRQKDAIRNSVNALGQFHFSHKSLQGLNVEQVRNKLLAEKDVNWNSLDGWKQRGSSWSKEDQTYSFGDCPVFSEYRNFIDKHLE